ncbi:MAG: hypothetical protein K2V38_28980, partial [Gemmataceae bacterium]|nr:hypothetical protein [Gemmataceae bacterium]
MRAAATFASVPLVLIRMLGFGGSSSLMSRTTSPNAAVRNRCRSSGVEPVSSSYSSTPSEYTSLRVSTPKAFISACSGLMY